MTLLQVFDPPMCCSTGVCGPGVDSELAQFAGDLDWLKSRGGGAHTGGVRPQP